MVKFGQERLGDKMAKFKLKDGRIIDVDEDEIRDLVIAGAGEETDSETPEQMRSRAKSEYSRDVQQQMSEYDDEHPYASTLMPKMTEAIKTNQPWYIQSTEAAKDIFSSPGIDITRYIRGTYTPEEERGMREEYPISMGISDFGKSIAESPLNIPLAPVAALGAGATGIGALGAGIGRFGITGGTVLGDIASERQVQGQEVTPLDYGIALASGILPEAASGVSKGIKYLANKWNIPGKLQAGMIESQIASNPKIRAFMEQGSPLKYGQKETLFLNEAGEIVTPQDRALLEAYARNAKSGQELYENTAKLVGGMAGSGVGSVVGGPIGSVIGSGLGNRLAGKLNPSAMETMVSRLQNGILKHTEIPQELAQGIAPVLAETRRAKETVSYNNALLSAMSDNKLSESEYRAYQRPENMARFYARFPEYR
jgi:hypothetical protein